MADSKEKLFSDFIAPTRQEWLDKINVDLKGDVYKRQEKISRKKITDLTGFFRTFVLLKLT